MSAPISQEARTTPLKHNSGSQSVSVKTAVRVHVQGQGGSGRDAGQWNSSHSSIATGLEGDDGGGF